MENRNIQKHDLSQDSLGFRIWIYFLCVVINIAVAVFMIVSKLIIIVLWRKKTTKVIKRVSGFLNFLSNELEVL